MREVAFPVMSAYRMVGPFLAFFLAYYLLAQHWDSYTLFWQLALAVNLAILA